MVALKNGRGKSHWLKTDNRRGSMLVIDALCLENRLLTLVFDHARAVAGRRNTRAGKLVSQSHRLKPGLVPYDSYWDPRWSSHFSGVDIFF